MSLGRNKEELVEFLFKTWSSETKDVFDGVELFVCHSSFCHRLYYDYLTGVVVSEEVDSLFCDHEEADTRWAVLK